MESQALREGVERFLHGSVDARHELIQTMDIENDEIVRLESSVEALKQILSSYLVEMITVREEV